MTRPCAPCDELRLPFDASAPSEARRFLSRAGRAMGLPAAVISDACLLVSELVTNAVRHGRVSGDVRVRARLAGPDALRVEVANPGDAFEPVAYEGGADQASGWGLQIVDKLASRWGVEGRRPTVVWFELPVA